MFLKSPTVSKKRVAVSALVAVALALLYLGVSKFRSPAAANTGNGVALKIPTSTQLDNARPRAKQVPTSGSHSALPTREALSASRSLVEQLGKFIHGCRDVRIADSVAGRTPGAASFNALGTETSCHALFEEYGPWLDVALYPLKASPEPTVRGQYYDANYDVLATNHLQFKIATDVGSPDRTLYEQLTEEHFEDVAKDLDPCDGDSVARAHLSQKLVSTPGYDNPAIQYFIARVMLTHAPDDIPLRRYNDELQSTSTLSQTVMNSISSAVRRATTQCGNGLLWNEMAAWKGYGK